MKDFDECKEIYLLLRTTQVLQEWQIIQNMVILIAMVKYLVINNLYF